MWLSEYTREGPFFIAHLNRGSNRGARDFCDGPRSSVCWCATRVGSQPRLERIRPDDCARVGEIDHLVRGGVMARPLCPPADVRIADLGERRPVDARQRTHRLIGSGCLVATIAAGVTKVQGISKPCIVPFSSARRIGKAIPPTQTTREIAKDHLYFCHDVLKTIQSLLPQPPVSYAPRLEHRLDLSFHKATFAVFCGGTVAESRRTGEQWAIGTPCSLPLRRSVPIAEIGSGV